ncbi:unnamed protein product [Cylindrotheca closterium]|uniref:Uncharacterized protein n=1 Tax=Cylindrotheca closterium TaxID=2856 RepID=A0AAD2GAD9_9STRA|nr:unnamed protein product [Cylindrotheca closterium]
MLAIHEGINPPFPENLDELQENSQKGFGQKLLNTVRRLEKIFSGQSADDVNSENTIDDAVSLFNQLISLFSRHGMLHGDSIRAGKILLSLKTSIKTKRPKGNKNNKQKNNSLSMDTSNEAESADSSGYEQEALIFTAILRVLNVENAGDDSMFQTDRNLVLALTAELCVAVSQFVQESNSLDVCCQAEYELILQTGKPLLAGLVKAMTSLSSGIQTYTKQVTGTSPSQCLTLAQLDADRHIDPLVSCLKATSSLVSLFGTKLSRSHRLLSDLRQLSWLFLTVNDSDVQTCSARLIATLPAAGGTDRTSPSDLWNQTMSDVIDLLARSTKAMAPLATSSKTNKKEDDSNLAEETRTAYQLWRKCVKEDLSDEMDRALTFRCFLSGLTKCFQSLLLLDGIGHGANASMMSGAKVNVQSILDVIETFVTFPLSAENLFYKTKKRLRNESIDGGLLSPRIAATMLGNDLKTFGHNMLDILLQCLGGPTLLPHSVRISRISYASLLTSCSAPLRKALDPTRSGVDGKKRKWLHQSIALRTVAINTLTASIAHFGIGRKEKSATSSRTSRSEGEMAAEYVAGCFLEEVIRGNEANGLLDDSWGSSSERVDLVVAALGCLRTVLVSCGGYLDMSSRSLIDSTVLTGLVEMEKQQTVLSSSAPTIAMLELSLCCITTPWNDGSMTSMYDSIVRIGRRCENHADVNVCKSAKSLLMVCNTVSVPRAPALLYVSRVVSNQPRQESTAAPERAASDLVNDLQKTRADIARAQRADEAMKKKKAEEKRRRQNEEAEETFRKRKKVETPPKPKASGKEDSKVENQAEKEVATEPTKPQAAIAKTGVEEKPESPETDPQKRDQEGKNDEIVDPTHSSDEEDAPMEEGDGDNFDFPDIVEGGGPDSDDE